MTTGRRIVLVLALAFFCLPIALRFAGVTAAEFENRPFAERPSLSDGWDVFDQTTRFAVDRLPLREQAVRARTWGVRDVLDAPPTWRQALLAGDAVTAAVPAQEAERPDEVPGSEAGAVIEGDDGWLFFRDDLARACAPPIERARAIRRMLALVQTLEEGGRKVSVVVPPDKTTVYPERIPADEPNRACATRYRERAWPALEAVRDPAVHPLRRSLLDEQARSDEPLYLRKDSHWNSLGAALALPAALDPLGLPARPDELVDAAPITYTGDLTTLSGQPEEDTAPQRVVRRPAGSRVLPGVTTFVSDSFGAAMIPLLTPYVEELRDVSWPLTEIPQIVEAIDGSDRVIVEVVERELDTAFADDGRLTGLLRLLRAREP